MQISAAVTPSNYDNRSSGFLRDPYEGETVTVLLDLFAEWEDPAERDLMWEVKRPMLQAVNYSVPGEALRRQGIASPSAAEHITVQRGFWFSTHEQVFNLVKPMKDYASNASLQWKTMLLPYFDVPLVRDVFANCERARTWDAFVNGVPGMFASINDVSTNEQIPDYVSATGIQSVAFQQVSRRDVITPYSTFALWMHNATAAGCWYRNMLAGPRMQGRHGSTEAVSTNGSLISPLTTWDSKETTILAMLGGVRNLTAAALKATDFVRVGSGAAYDRFITVITREYGAVFNDLSGTTLPFALPATAVPACPDCPVWQCA
jgi:hypothetical protein